MNYTREGLLLPETNDLPVDSGLANSLEASHLGAQATYKELTIAPSRKAEVVASLKSGESPDMSAKQLDRSKLQERLQKLQDWKRELLLSEDVHDDIRQMYRWRVNEDIANVNMLLASSNGDMRNFKRWNEFIYGAPDELIYRGALDWVANDADELIQQPNQHPAVVAAAQRVSDLLEGERGYRELLAPEEKTFQDVKSDHYRKETGYYTLLLAGVEIPTEGKVTNEVGDPILRHVIRNNLESAYSLTDAAGATWGVNHSDESVERPAKINMNPQRFVGLGLGHEIGSHLLERVNGSRGPVALARDGLDRYELGNEGRATIREQVTYDSFEEFGELVRWRDILRRDIAVSYGHGVGGSAPMPADEVYAFMNAIDAMYQTKLTPDDAALTQEKAGEKAAALVARVIKGTDGTGGAYLKDKVYLEGHVACWRSANLQGAGVISLGDLGKFDINNPRHIVRLQKQGLLPDNKD